MINSPVLLLLLLLFFFSKTQDNKPITHQQFHFSSLRSALWCLLSNSFPGLFSAEKKMAAKSPGNEVGILSIFLLGLIFPLIDNSGALLSFMLFSSVTFRQYCVCQNCCRSSFLHRRQKVFLSWKHRWGPASDFQQCFLERFCPQTL